MKYVKTVCNVATCSMTEAEEYALSEDGKLTATGKMISVFNPANAIPAQSHAIIDMAGDYWVFAVVRC